jgi:hypothetical protein
MADPSPAPDLAPLSFQQENMLRIMRTWPECGQRYDIARLFELRGPIDAGALVGAVGDVVDRHGVLRTTIGRHEGHYVQRVHVSLVEEVARSVETGSPSSVADRILAGRLRTNDVLGGRPLFRAQLFALAPRHHLLAVAIHHLVCDGLTLYGLWRDLSEFYAARVDGRPPHLPPLTTTYAQYARQQRDRWRTCGEPAMQYWRHVTAGAPERAAWPRPAAAAPRYETATRVYSLQPDEVDAVRRLSRAVRVTPFLVLLAATGAAVARVTGQGDALLLTDLGDRDAVFKARLVGLLLNTRLTRVRPIAGQSCAELVSHVREAWLGSEEYQDVDLDWVLHEIGIGPAALVPVHLDTEDLRANPDFAGAALTPMPLPHADPYWRDWIANWRLAAADWRVEVTHRTSMVAPHAVDAVIGEITHVLRSGAC